MRELKFRAWDIENKKMIPVGTLEFFHGGDIHINKTNPETYQGKQLRVLMQYTGLKDINGKDVYEDDILKLSYGIPPASDMVQVVWYSDYYLDMEEEKNISYCGWFFKNLRENGCSAPAGIEYQDDIEIQGNIHENANLLKSTIWPELVKNIKNNKST